jgi:hypothetical protein
MGANSHQNSQGNMNNNNNCNMNLNQSKPPSVLEFRVHVAPKLLVGIDVIW